MKPALHRSVWFWLGCFVLVFLVWAWVSSWKTMRTVRRDWVISGGGGMESHADLVRVSDGRIGIQWCRATLTDPGMRLLAFPVKYRRNGTARTAGIAMPKVERFVREQGKLARVVYDVVEVPMWGIVLLYLMGCGGVLVWRQRRWKRFLLDGGENAGDD